MLKTFIIMGGCALAARTFNKLVEPDEESSSDRDSTPSHGSECDGYYTPSSSGERQTTLGEF